MSAARIEHLKALLSRVQERREQPRLRSVTAGQEDERVSEVVATARAARVPPIQPPLSIEPISILENVEQALPPVVISSTPQPAAARETSVDDVARRAPTRSDMPKVVKEDSDDPEIETSFDSEPPTGPSDIPEALIDETPLELTAPSQVVTAPRLSQSTPVVQIVSAPRVEAPKNFGELLEASLALRPR